MEVAKREGDSLAPAAGILIRISDDMSDYHRPWKVGGPFGRKFADRWPATFLNSRHAGTYGQGWGLVLDPSHVTIQCGYAADGRSMDKSCDSGGGSCIPGCTPQTSWCTPASVSTHDSCAWKADELDMLLRQADRTNPWGHNEIVLEPRSLMANLPRSVLAVFTQEQNSADARNAHRSFLADFGLTAKSFPLLHLQHSSGHNDAHFICAVCS